MRATTAALRFAVPFLCLAAVGGCKKDTPFGDGKSTNAPIINLFGFEESQLHHIHNTVELHRNIFLVHYDPNQPDVLEWVNCPIAATYEYRQANGRRVESIYIKSQQELAAKVPVNYARFSGFIKNGKALEFNYVTIGSYELLSDFRIPRDDRDCARATHYVVTLSVGAFNYGEQRDTQGGVQAAESTTGVGVGVSAGRSSGEMTSMGDLDSCMDDAAALNDCFTPLQVLMMPLADRHWGDTAVTVEPHQGGQSGSSAGSGGDTHVATDLALHVDENAWRPGSFMAMALERLLILATRIDVSSDFGFDDMGSTVMAGFLTDTKPQVSSRPFAEGKTYAIAGAGSTGADINLVVRDSSGNVVASDTETDGNPVVTFTPTTTDNFLIELSLVGQTEEFGAVVVMQDGGLRISAEILQAVFQRLLDAGTYASGKVQEMGLPNGLVFHETEWAVQGTVLYAGEAIRQSGIKLTHPSVFAAVSHEEALNIDLEVVDAQSGQSWADTEPDSNPLVFIDEPNPDSSYDLRVIYGAGESATLATSLILHLSD